MKVDVTHELVNVGTSFRHISRLHRHQLYLCFSAKFFLQQLDDARNLNGAIVPDIVDSPRAILLAGSNSPCGGMESLEGTLAMTRTSASTTLSI
jgi:hypothetical protein